jgi:hypothetical protein
MQIVFRVINQYLGSLRQPISTYKGQEAFACDVIAKENDEVTVKVGETHFAVYIPGIKAGKIEVGVCRERSGIAFNAFSVVPFKRLEIWELREHLFSCCLRQSLGAGYKKTAWDISLIRYRGTGIPANEIRKAHALRRRLTSSCLLLKITSFLYQESA